MRGKLSNFISANIPRDQSHLWQTSSAKEGDTRFCPPLESETDESTRRRHFLPAREIAVRIARVRQKPPTTLSRRGKRKKKKKKKERKKERKKEKEVRRESYRAYEETETVNYRTGTRQSWKPVGHTFSPNQSCEKHREYERMVKQKKKRMGGRTRLDKNRFPAQIKLFSVFPWRRTMAK